MLNFLKVLLASCLGVMLGIIALTIIGAFIIGGLAESATHPKSIESNSVLRLTFDKAVPEHTNNMEVASFTDLGETEVLGLTDLVQTIERAKGDDRIKGIFLEPDFASMSGFATARVIREALKDFKKSGKFIVAHGKIFMQGNYYLASVADELYINPLGVVEVRGFSVQIPFYKRLFDRLGLNMQIYYAGKFKGATEPYRLDKLSPENRLQYREFLADFYDIFLQDVAASRKMKLENLRGVVDGYLASSPETAVQYGMADKVLYRQEVLDIIRKKLGLRGEKEEISFVSLEDYHKGNPEKTNFKAKDKIAVVYAEGTILDGKGSNGVISDGQYVKVIQKLVKDDAIRAIVLRVNSPGGSALASENIWYALSQAKEAKKPVVVSMGDYAASGGYYISCLADSILAEPNTITGSIGVFRIIPSVEKTMSDKVGITFDSVNTGPFAAGINIFFNQGPEEARKMQASTDEMYEVFLDHVAKGRNMTRDSVHAIAQGRVWSGRDALRIGLVDRLGGLDEAIETAARMSKTKSYRVAEYPRVKDPITQLLEEFSGQDESAQTAKMIKKEFPQWQGIYQDLMMLKGSNGVQARIPFVVPFN